ncbi:MAG: SpoIID/LytB domain-containing protein [Elusimicrobia bacterium]|nr:SpoIID/LytB domain-containing protein [Elusimicrobiota bacterium]
MLRLAASLVFAFCVSVNASDGAQGDSGPRIRVAIVRDSPPIKLKTSVKTYVQEVKTGQKYLLLANAYYEIRSFGTQSLSVANQKLSSPIRLLAADGSEKIRLGGNIYKGDMLIKVASNGRLDIIEELPLEDYLYGVLPSEMSPSWPLEALKAQAVASRSYAAKNINPAKDFDITSGADMQVYNGTKGVNSRILEAVNSTRGEVLKYKGKIITAFFHSCCGGRTASAKAYWGEEVVKPLEGVSDPYCSLAAHYQWSFHVPYEDLLTFVQNSGSTALKIKAIKVYKKDRSGRALSLLFHTDQGDFQLPAGEFRKNFGSNSFRSTYITRIKEDKSGYEFYGRGWGHGVGLCQEGAKEMAARGKSYKKILRHYYPGASITDYDN